ncbi:MAG: hypothetical protein IKL52_07135 [Candidatus Gastranaerophilales bacterium]|nr:hypothetical protein [Candidatus Gastranaerophilales bacterium]
MLNFGQIKALSDIIQTIKKNSGHSDRLSEELSTFFKENNLDDINIAEFSEYVKQVDYKQLRQLAPKPKNTQAKNY